MARKKFNLYESKERERFLLWHGHSFLDTKTIFLAQTFRGNLWQIRLLVNEDVDRRAESHDGGDLARVRTGGRGQLLDRRS